MFEIKPAPLMYDGELMMMLRML